LRCTMATNVTSTPRSPSSVLHDDITLQPAVTSNFTINDRRFWLQLTSARELKDFLISELVMLDEAALNSVQFGELDNVRYSSSGRTPSIEEWRVLDSLYSALAKHLNDTLRRKRGLLRLKPYFRTLPLVFLSVAIFSLILDSSTRYMLDAAGNSTALGTGVDLASNMLWILSLGGLGTCGFLGTSLIAESKRVKASPPSPVTQTSRRSAPHNRSTIDIKEIDLTDGNSIVTRIVVGILFAFMFGLPAYQSSNCLHNLILGTSLSSKTGFASQFALTLVPFVLGFSTTLVLGIMERFIAAIGSLFGVSNLPRN
jgi:hypothetical protein